MTALTRLGAHVLILCSLVCGLRAQRTWVVDWLQRPGTDFTSIQPAVDAAASGDTVLVRGTGPIGDPTYHAYPAPIIDAKGITILGEGASTMLSGAFVIQNTGDAQIVNLVRFQRGLYGVDTLNYMDIVNCQGLVLLDSLDIVGRNRITQSRLVVSRQCRIKQVAGFQITDSSFMVDGMTTDYFLLQLAGWPPLIPIRSRLWISNSTIRAQSCEPNTQGADPAIHTRDSDIWIGPSTTLIGGVRCSGIAEVFYDEWLSGSGSSCTTYTIPPSRFHFDPTVQLFGGYGICLFDVGPLTSIWSTRTANTLTVEQRCAPSSVTVLALGPFAVTPIASLLTPLAIDVSQAILCMSAAPISGAFALQFPIPPTLPPGFHIGMQAGALSPQGVLSLSNASTFSIW